MIDTTRIASGFDIELQLGANWFRTALNQLNDHQLLGPPGLPIFITDVQISFEPDWDLRIDIAGLPLPVFAKAALTEDGRSLTLSTNMPDVPPSTIPFGVLNNLSGLPILVKRAGDANHEAVIAVLANMKIHAEAQNEVPFDLETSPLERGIADNAMSFLPLGKDVAFGMSKATFERFANNLWHTQLRAADGTHPLPNEEKKRGEWSKVTMSASGGKIQIKLEGDAPIDTPVIDVVPDPHVTITLTITPSVNNGVLSFSISPDSDVDTGLLGDLFGAIAGAIGGGVAGGIIGFIVGLLTGGILSALLTGLVVGAGIGLVVGIIVVEIAEVVIEGIAQREIKALLNGEPLADLYCDEAGIVQVARPDQESGFNLSVLDTIPVSIPIHTDYPEDESLYKQSLLVSFFYDAFVADANGFAVEGLSGTAEKFLPERVSIRQFNYVGDVLESITYRRNDGSEQQLSLEEVLERCSEGELKAPFKLKPRPTPSSLRIPEGKLACVVLKPVAIHREDTVVTEIEFEQGLRLRVPDAVLLQDNAAIVVAGFQLIHPKNYKPYFRAKADFFKDNNFESLPEFV